MNQDFSVYLKPSDMILLRTDESSVPDLFNSNLTGFIQIYASLKVNFYDYLNLLQTILLMLCTYCAELKWD